MTILPHCPSSREEVGHFAITRGKGLTEKVKAFSSEGVLYIDFRRKGRLVRRSYQSRQEFLEDWTSLRHTGKVKE